MKLLKYKFKTIIPFGDGEHKTIYELTLLKSYWFGLRKKEIKIDYEIPMFASIKEHEKHWDELIKTKNQLK